MDLQLNGKTALVSGSTRGIGYATAKLLAEEGAHVIVNGRKDADVTAAINKMKTQCLDVRISGIAADLSTASGCQKLTQSFPEVDILINNMGIFNPVSFEEISDDEWNDMFQTNVMSGVRLSRHYITSMRKNNWGRIIFISSESAVQIPAEMIHYGMSKSAQVSIARGLAETTRGSGVTVNSILPGPTLSDGADIFFNKLAEEQNLNPEDIHESIFTEARPTSLLQRFATVEEVANMIVYVCSPLSSATNGAALRVEGGVIKSAF